MARCGGGERLVWSEERRKKKRKKITWNKEQREREVLGEEQKE